MEQESLPGLEILAPEPRPTGNGFDQAHTHNGKGHTTRRLERIARGHARSLLESVLVAAKAGNMQAAKMVLDRIWPEPRGAAVMIGMRKTQTPADIREAMHEVLGRAASGEISPADAQSFFAMLKDTYLAHTVDSHRLPFDGAVVPVSDARHALAERLKKTLAARTEAANLPNE